MNSTPNPPDEPDRRTSFGMLAAVLASPFVTITEPMPPTAITVENNHPGEWNWMSLEKLLEKDTDSFHPLDREFIDKMKRHRDNR